MCVLVWGYNFAVLQSRRKNLCQCDTPLVLYAGNDLWRQVSNIFEGECITHLPDAGSGGIKLQELESGSLNKSNDRKGTEYSDQLIGC